MRVISIVVLFLLVSCSSKRIMKEYDFDKANLSKYRYPTNTAYTPTDEERVYFESVMDLFLKVYKDIRPKEYLFESVFSKNKYGEIEVWVQAVYFGFIVPVEEIEGPVSVSDPGKSLHYAVINISRDKAYFYRTLDPQNPLDHVGVKCYFYMNGKTKEVVNNLSMIYDTEIWRDFDFEDWVSVDNSDE